MCSSVQQLVLAMGSLCEKRSNRSEGEQHEGICCRRVSSRIDGEQQDGMCCRRRSSRGGGWHVSQAEAWLGDVSPLTPRPIAINSRGSELCEPVPSWGNSVARGNRLRAAAAKLGIFSHDSHEFE